MLKVIVKRKSEGEQDAGVFSPWVRDTISMRK
jgi:hypothetical protein